MLRSCLPHPLLECSQGVVKMAFNSSHIITQPFDTIFSAFVDLLGNGFFLIPITFLAVGLYMKYHNLVVVFAFLTGACSLLSSGAIFIDYPEMAYIYAVFSGLAIAGLILSVLFIRR